jgi:hypothetical protein
LNANKVGAYALLPLLLVPPGVVLYTGIFRIASCAHSWKPITGPVFEYGFSRFFAVIVSTAPYLLIASGIFMLVYIPTVMLCENFTVAAMVALLACLLNPWSVRIAMASPLLAVHDLPVRGIFRVTLKITKGRVWLMIRALYLPSMLMAVINYFLSSLVGGYGEKFEDQLLGLLVTLPLEIYSTTFAVGCLVYLSRELYHDNEGDSTAMDPIASSGSCTHQVY